MKYLEKHHIPNPSLIEQMLPDIQIQEARAPQEGEQVTPDHLNLLILFTCGQALIIMVHHKHLSLPLCVTHLPLEAGEGDGLVPLVFLGPRCDPSRGGDYLARRRCPRLTEINSCTLSLYLFALWA